MFQRLDCSDFDIGYAITVLVCSDCDSVRMRWYLPRECVEGVGVPPFDRFRRGHANTDLEALGMQLRTGLERARNATVSHYVHVLRICVLSSAIVFDVLKAQTD